VKLTQMKAEFGWERLGTTQMALRDRRLASLVGVLAALLVVLSMIPWQWLRWSGELQFGGTVYSTQLAALLSVGAVLLALRLLLQGTIDTRYERAVVLAVAAGLLVVSGDALRKFLEEAILREFWRPANIFRGDPGRALPIIILLFALITYAAIAILSIVAFVTAALPRGLLGTGRGERMRQFAHRASHRMGVAACGIFVVHALGSYAISEQLFEALGKSSPTTGGTPNATALKTVFFGGWLHLENLGVVEYVAGVWGAVALAQLIASASPRLAAKAVRRSDKFGQAWLPAVLGLALFAAAFVVGRRRARLPHLASLWSSVRHGRLAVDISNWLRANGNLSYLHVNNTYVLLAVGVVSASGLIALTFWTSVLTENGGVAASTAERARYSAQVDKTFQRIEPVAIPLLVLIMPMVPAMSRLLVGAPMNLFRFIWDRHDPIRFYSTIHAVPISGAVTPEHLLVPVFMGIGALAIPFWFVERRRSIALAVSTTCLATAVVVSSNGRVDMWLAYGAGFLFVAPLLVFLNSSGTDTADAKPRITVCLTVALTLGISVMVCYRLSPDLPPPVLLLGLMLLQFGVLAGPINEGASRKPHAVQTYYSLPLLVGAIALAAHQPNHWVDAIAYNSAAQAVAVPFIALPLTLAMILRTQSTSMSWGAATPHDASAMDEIDWDRYEAEVAE